MPEILLTIAIPTYNRGKFLTRCLQYILLQKDTLDEVELIVSDNASVDDTADVVQEFIAKGLKINFLRNEINKGADFNIAQCYNSAKGQFVLTLGDDDVLVKNSIPHLLALIKSNADAGVIFLSSVGIAGVEYALSFDDKLNYKVYETPAAFLHYITYYVTFISGNIINRKAIEAIDINKWIGSNLVQVPMILTAIKMFSKNIVVTSVLLGVQIDNTGGYNLYDTFGRSLNEIVVAVFNGKFEKYQRIIIDDLFVRFFPIWIRHLQKDNKFDTNAKPEEIKKLLRYNKYYKLTVAPLLVLPANLNVVYFYGIKLFGMARRKTLLALNSK